MRNYILIQSMDLRRRMLVQGAETPLCAVVSRAEVKAQKVGQGDGTLLFQAVSLQKHRKTRKNTKKTRKNTKKTRKKHEKPKKHWKKTQNTKKHRKKKKSIKKHKKTRKKKKSIKNIRKS